MRRYKVTATTVGIMVLVAALVGFGAVVLADQPKDSAANQPQPASQLQNQAPEVEGCGAWTYDHLGEIFPSQDAHAMKYTFYHIIKDSVCSPTWGACFRDATHDCAWIITVEPGHPTSKCRNAG